MSDLLIDVTGGVMTITLNRPSKKNAITDAMYGDFASGLKRAAADPSISVVMICGAGPDFCAGNDIGVFAEANASGQDMRETNTSVWLDAITHFPKPLIGVATGRAIGVGVTMLMHCDLVYVAQDCEMRTPFVDLALVPEAGSTLTMPARIGHVRAFALFALGESISGEDAVALGIANRAAPPEQVADLALASARRLASKPLSSLMATKRLMRDPAPIARAIEAESVAFVEQLASPEAKAAFAAFAARKR